MFCNQCGAQLPENTVICPVCGADNTAFLATDAAVNDALDSTAQAIQQPEPPVETLPAPESPVEAPAQEESSEPQGKVNFVTPIYARPCPTPVPSVEDAAADEVPSPFRYFLMQLLMSLPLVGLIVSVLWAVDDSGPLHRRNFATGNLLFLLVKLAINLLLLAILLGLTNLFLSQLYTASYYAAPFDGFTFP